MERQKALNTSPFCDRSTGNGKGMDEALDQQRLTFATDFVCRLQQDGFVRLCGHGISASEISQAFQAHKTFFDLPLDRKQEVLYLGGARPARGFTPSHTEKTFLHKPHLSQAAEDAAETREQFTLGPPEDRDFPTPWFEDNHLASCYATLVSFYDDCRLVALGLVQAIELGLGLQRGALTEHYLPDASELTLNWYPKASRAALLGPSLKRIWPHSDLGIISLLFQDGIGGLEFEDRKSKGHFVPVEPGVGVEMIVNASDTLERWTNGVISAGIHRVTAPSTMQESDGKGGIGAKVETVPERRSIVLLYRSKGEASVAPLADFVKTDKPAQFGEMTATEYLNFKNKLTFGNIKERN
ncbi:hypothetical protein MMC17_009928 [Xylographa soralifera]|nr:hypothetical protein [Xylographa soralifera]